MPTVDHVIEVQVILENDSALPRDRVINTFHYVTSNPTIAPTATELGEIRDRLLDCYSNPQTGSTNSLGSLLSAALTGGISMKMFDLHDATPRVPILDTGPLTPFTTGTTALPAEVAMCMSYQAVPVSGQSQRRRRGRIFFGPLASNSVLVTTTGKPSTSANAIVDTIVAFGGKWKTGTASDCVPVIYSPTGNSYADVNNGWVDDEFDTQRRRGYRPSTRQTF